MKEICSHNSCTGCKACINTCTHKAILFNDDEYGFWYPVVDEEKCVNCGLCENICPSNNSPEMHKPIQSLIGHAKDIEEQKTSTSGGLASALCRQILRQGGVVYGCTSAHYPKIHHVRVKKEEELSLLKGSKYVVSDVEDVFKQIRQDLKNRQVVFVGTPCQCAGLKNYIKSDHNNLLLIDFVCHGVPSQKILHDAIDEVRKDSDVATVAFRKKLDSGESKYGLYLKGADGRSVYEGSFPKDDYIVTFLSGFFYRPSCYECKYAKIERCSDITLGDYWDRGNESMLSSCNFGLSMIMANTEKGEILLEKNVAFLNLIEGEIYDFVKRNGQLNHPMPRHKQYDQFHRIYKSEGWPGVLVIIKDEKKKLMKTILKNQLRDLILRFTKASILFNLKTRIK